MQIGDFTKNGVTEKGRVQFDESGSDVTFLLNNTSDTASSDAQSIMRVEGTSAGDPFQKFQVGTTASFSIGMDNTDDDLLKITGDSSGVVDPSSGTLLMAFDEPNVKLGIFTVNDTVGPLDVLIRKSVSGDLVNCRVTNDNVDAGSGSAYSITATNGDVTLGMGDLTNAVTFQVGIDSPSGGLFKIGVGLLPSTLTVQSMVSTPAGEVTFPSTPAFLATHSVAQDNVTGAGTGVTPNFTTEIFDQNSDYDGTNTFTAPVTGRYIFTMGIRFSDIGANAAICSISLITSNRSYQSYSVNATNVERGDGVLDCAMTMFADMDAADTCLGSAVITGMAGDTVDLPASVTTTFFSGSLQC